MIQSKEWGGLGSQYIYYLLWNMYRIKLRVEILESRIMQYCKNVGYINQLEYLKKLIITNTIGLEL